MHIKLKYHHQKTPLDKQYIPVRCLRRHNNSITMTIITTMIAMAPPATAAAMTGTKKGAPSLLSAAAELPGLRGVLQ